MLKRIKKIKVPVINDGERKSIVRGDGESNELLELEVIGYDDHYEEYLVNIPPEMAGFVISNFHILYYQVAPIFLGKRFNSISILEILN